MSIRIDSLGNPTEVALLFEGQRGRELVCQLICLVTDDEYVTLLSESVQEFHELFCPNAVKRRVKHFVEDQEVAVGTVLDSGDLSPSQKKRQVDTQLLAFTETHVRECIPMTPLDCLVELLVQMELGKEVH